jgi:hypothetical protein
MLRAMVCHATSKVEMEIRNPGLLQKLLLLPATSFSIERSLSKLDFVRQDQLIAPRK